MRRERRRGRRRHFVSSSADGLERSRRAEHEVVQHAVRIRQHDLDEPPRRHRQLREIEAQLILHSREADDDVRRLRRDRGATRRPPRYRPRP